MHSPHRRFAWPVVAPLAAWMIAGVVPAHSQEAPKPAPEIQRITALAGTFEGEASFTQAGKTVKFALHHQNRVIAGGFGLACHEEADIPGLGHYEAEDLFGWDVNSKTLHLFSVTNDPDTHDHAGRWSDATHATLRCEGQHSGQRMVEVLPLEIVGPNEYRFRSNVTLNGKPDDQFTAVMKRVGTDSAR